MPDKTDAHVPARKAEETRKVPIEDVRGTTTTTFDRSAHRRHHWLYEDLLA